MFDVTGLAKIIGAISKSACEVKEKSDNSAGNSRKGNRRKEDRVGAVYN